MKTIFKVWFLGTHCKLFSDPDMLLQYTDYWHKLIFEQSDS